MLKRIGTLSIFSFVAFVALMLTVNPAQPANYVFLPDDPDLQDLPHQSYFTWGINWTLPIGQIITAAEIKYVNIYNWTSESGDRLYTNLLNSVTDPNGSSSPNWISKIGYQTITIQGTDNESNTNAFSGPGVYNLAPPPGYWTDPDDNQTTSTFSYFIPSAYFSWISDGNFGFGIDPDCHYYNDKVKFIITTQPVPEPATMLLLGSGLIGLAGFARRRFKK